MFAICSFLDGVLVHGAQRIMPAVTLGIADRDWTIGDLIDAVLPLAAELASARNAQLPRNQWRQKVRTIPVMLQMLKAF
jgi:hypothetical protein